MRGPLFEDSYKPQFSGHETFPLRYGWLKKAFDCVAETETEPQNRDAVWGEGAIARFGVGKNMVASIRHWAKATGIVEEPSTNTVRTTELGQLLFGTTGLDPFMEHPTTSWLVHWQLAGHEDKTTWFWAFNHFPAVTFERDSLISRIERLVSDRGWTRIAHSTIKNDVACFVRTYVARHPLGASPDDFLESPLTELGLLKAVGKKDGFRFVRGPKTSLGDGIFTYALLDFWSRYRATATLSFEAIAHAPGSPGRAFQFDENDVADRLARLEDTTKGALRWAETAGLKQVVRTSDIEANSALEWLQQDYGVLTHRRAA